ncbi:MAG: replicative DNA helicase [Candidatus Phytoplasma cynodontis]|uniref:replicative DNA helicase n=1 Tax='Cynodon dactylon' phytoplasma TaxID=295320 RepID=UPI001265B810|nr:replicative DNA helicase ['Cynodon dactylon' phytoplasma]KAB8122081.1 replicative DNA helicase ['Cynodon dactylon' phytoplasma]WIA07502.1 MAG: replicative DNA helicase [Candidatus Phytoplasma cynodontis]
MNQNFKLPYYLEAEQSILGIIFLDPKQIINIVNRLEVSDFFNIDHQYIYLAMKELYYQRKEIDYYSVYIFLEEKKKYIEGGRDYLIKLGSLFPSIYHLDNYIEFLLEASLKREIINAASTIVHDGINNNDIDSQSFLNFAEEKIFQISQKKKSSHFIRINSLLQEIKEKTINIRREHNIIGLSSGYENLDEITLGFKPEELIILAARPSMGKSSFMMNIAVNIAQKNKNSKASVAIFSLEMSNEQLGTRMLSFISEIPHKNIQLGILSEKQINLLNASIYQLETLNIYFDDTTTVNILDIISQCRKLKNQNKLDIVIIDYLQLIKKPSKSNSHFFNRQEEVSDISKSLKQMARELKVPVIALSQLSREVEKREDKRPILSDLRDSGSIEQDADIVMFLYRKGYYNKYKNETNEIDNNIKGYTELIIAKNRQGATSTKTFNFDSNCLLFYEIELNKEI